MDVSDSQSRNSWDVCLSHLRPRDADVHVSKAIGTCMPMQPTASLQRPSTLHSSAASHSSRVYDSSGAARPAQRSVISSKSIQQPVAEDAGWSELDSGQDHTCMHAMQACSVQVSCCGDRCAHPLSVAQVWLQGPWCDGTGGRLGVEKRQ